MNTLLLCILCISTSLIGLDVLALNRKLAKVLKPPESQPNLTPTGRRCPRCCGITYNIKWIANDGQEIRHSWCPDCGAHDTGHVPEMPSVRNFGARGR